MIVCGAIDGEKLSRRELVFQVSFMKKLKQLIISLFIDINIDY